MQRLSAAALWDTMSTAVRADLPRLFFLVAPFALLPAVAVELFGPPAPTSLDAISNQQLLWRLAVPSPPRAWVLKKFKYRSLLRAGHLLNLCFVTTILNE